MGTMLLALQQKIKNYQILLRNVENKTGCKMAVGIVEILFTPRIILEISRVLQFAKVKI